MKYILTCVADLDNEIKVVRKCRPSKNLVNANRSIRYVEKRIKDKYLKGKPIDSCKWFEQYASAVEEYCAAAVMVGRPILARHAILTLHCIYDGPYSIDLTSEEYDELNQGQ